MTDYPVDLTVRPEVEGFFDPVSNTISYIVRDPSSDACAIFDSVLDMDYAAGRIAYDSADRLIRAIRESDRRVEWIIETHVHADHLSAAPYLQDRLGGRIGVGARIMEVQEVFGKVFNEGSEFQRDGSQFDALFEDGQTYRIGTMQAFAMATPGHTPACMVHVAGDAAFAGDTLFMPDGGSARADFPGGDAGELYDRDDDRRAAGAQHSCGWRQDPRGIREIPHRTRRAAGHAPAHHPVAAGEYAGRRNTARWRCQPGAQGAVERVVTRMPAVGTVIGSLGDALENACRPEFSSRLHARPFGRPPDAAGLHGVYPARRRDATVGGEDVPEHPLPPGKRHETKTFGVTCGAWPGPEI